MDIILDTLFYTIYVLKFINLGFVALSLHLTEKLFSEMYMKKVYALDENPPSLNRFIGLFLLIHSGFNLFNLIILILLHYMFKTPGGTFFINWYLISTYLKDFLLINLFLVIVSIIISGLIQKKKYFRYRTEGLRAIRGFREIMFFAACVVYIIPFFYFIM